ncbi:hypothetical protein HMPREF3033_00677 [Veillonellaceae bacterium DNF00751]|nr:hypothetical protein HMPREF3033_00677 [Veillonellaceae bacterium DNF00751]
MHAYGRYIFRKLPLTESLKKSRLNGFFIFSISFPECPLTGVLYMANFEFIPYSF